jgi:hypothetical protein
LSTSETDTEENHEDMSRMIDDEDGLPLHQHTFGNQDGREPDPERRDP